MATIVCGEGRGEEARRINRGVFPPVPCAQLMLPMALLLVLFSRTVASQTIAGRVVDELTGRRVADMRVMLISLDSVAVDTSRTDSAGTFYLEAPRAGGYRLMLIRANGDQWEASQLSMSSEAFVQREFRVPRTTPYFEFEVTKPVRKKGFRSPNPIYPDLQRMVGDTGRVVAQFVVDTTGHVDMHTFKVIEMTHSAFIEPVRQSLVRASFEPAEINGRKVRQLVQQPFDFRIRN